MVLYSYYKRKLAVTSAVVVLLCRLNSLFLNFTFYSSVNNAQSWRRNVGGSYKYYTCVVFRSSHFGNSSILSFHFFLSKMWNKTIIWNKTVILFQLLIKNLRSCFSSFAKRGIMQNSVEIFIANCQNLFSLLLKLFHFVGSRWFGHSHIMKSFCLLMNHLSRYVGGFSLPSWSVYKLNKTLIMIRRMRRSRMYLDENWKTCWRDGWKVLLHPYSDRQ